VSAQLEYIRSTEEALSPPAADTPPPPALHLWHLSDVARIVRDNLQIDPALYSPRLVAEMRLLMINPKSPEEAQGERDRHTRSENLHRTSWIADRSYRFTRGMKGQTADSTEQTVRPWDPGRDTPIPLNDAELLDIAEEKVQRRNATKHSASLRKLAKFYGSAARALEMQFYQNAHTRVAAWHPNDRSLGRCERCCAPDHVDVEHCLASSSAPPPIQPHVAGNTNLRATDHQPFDWEYDPLCQMCNMRGHHQRQCVACTACGRWGHTFNQCESGFARGPRR
jgi:hypothetical protein